jgi:hypothetical protein
MTAMRLRPTSPKAEGETAAYFFRPICGAPPALSAASAGRPLRHKRDGRDAACITAHRADSVSLAAGALLEVGDDLVLVAQRGHPAARRQLRHVEHAALQQLRHLRAAGDARGSAGRPRQAVQASTQSFLHACHQMRHTSCVPGLHPNPQPQP